MKKNRREESHSIFTKEHIDTLIRSYREGLLEDTLPFWIHHGVDREFGGFLTCLDRDGSVLDTDKGMWQQCRFTWLLSTLYNEVEKRSEWLALAKHGVDFIRRSGFDTDGRMFFHVTREGKPVRKRRYLFTETFGAIALAAYAKAAREDRAAEEGRRLFQLAVRRFSTPGGIVPKTFPATRPLKSMAQPMITIAAAQVLRGALDDPSFTAVIDENIEMIRRDFMKPELEALMETVGPNGEFLDHFEGRMLTPGHAIEAAAFILAEAKHRGGDPKLVETGATILDWMWRRGWDERYGGILYYGDVKGLPVQEYWHDMKFWWPQNETETAALLAYVLTGEEKYAKQHRLVHEWSRRHFPDPEYGEWFGYLHRDGSVSLRLKGNLWKGPFHLPRMQLNNWKLLQEMKQQNQT